mgnify:CR=1 FL=1
MLEDARDYATYTATIARLLALISKLEYQPARSCAFYLPKLPTPRKRREF